MLPSRFKFVWIILGAVVTAALLWFFRSTVVYVLVAAVLTMVGRPVVEFLHGRRIGRFQIPRGLAAMVTLLMFFISILLFIALLIPVIIQEINVLTSIDFNKVAARFRGPMDEYSELLRGYGMEVDVYKNTGKYLNAYMEELLNSDFFAGFVSVVSGVGDVVALVFSVSFITFFLLKDREILRETFKLLTPKKYARSASRAFDDSRKLLRRYFIGVALQISLISTLYFVGFWIAGVKNALLIAFLAGLLNIIPFVGPLIGVGLGLLIVISTGLQAEEALGYPLLLMGIVFLVVQTLDNVLFQPMIFSSSVKAHPLELFLVILMAAQVGGVWAMILAIPVYTVIRVVAKEFFSHLLIVQKLAK